MNTKRAPRNVLTHAEFYSLCEWLKTTDLTGLYTRTDVAAAATKALGTPVSQSAVHGALETTGIKLPERPVQMKQKRDRTVIIARELVAFMKSHGFEPSDELISVSHGTGIK